MTLTQARKETQRFLQPINDVEEGIEYSAKIMNDFIGQWRALVKPNLKRSTQEGYEWAFKRINKSFGPVPVSEIEKVDVRYCQMLWTGRVRRRVVRSVLHP